MNVYFELSLPEEEQELITIVRSRDYLAALADFREWLRALNKYGNPYDNANEAVEKIYMEYCHRTKDFLLE